MYLPAGTTTRSHVFHLMAGCDQSIRVQNRQCGYANAIYKKSLCDKFVYVAGNFLDTGSSCSCRNLLPCVEAARSVYNRLGILACGAGLFNRKPRQTPELDYTV